MEDVELGAQVERGGGARAIDGDDAPVMNAAPLPATGGAAPLPTDGQPAVQLVAVRTDKQQPPASLIVLTGGLLLALFLVGWSFVRR